ncbi:TPA: IS1595-like element ISGoba1 family transposase [Patescibacteria group bacterium]|uniref:Transposase n=1 Tax=Candidatus Gottesmanbacteria bacterium GW2011_GWA1_43_11 TaxID=1618436 RepID=A0A0G1CG49_9BACT|nr:MAG: Transposase [Candidatus Gottesmanbacteria bacterium GW2011_GWA1_43_11]HCS78659.1 IS1595-like element ISGoba1 family transposase [Patescibacteria group bacterium]
MKNKYYHKSHISERTFRKILRCFSSDFDATQTSIVSGISRTTLNHLFALFRKRIVSLTTQRKKVNGTVEIDESYFGARRVRGKRGRGATGEVPVLGILKRNGKVLVTIIENCSRSELMPIIKGKVLAKAHVYTDGWRAYDGLITLGYKHYRIHHQENEFARGKNHVNGIESFWPFTKRRLMKFNGIHKSKFLLHLKESEYRWNTRENMYIDLLKSFRKNPL